EEERDGSPGGGVVGHGAYLPGDGLSTALLGIRVRWAAFQSAAKSGFRRGSWRVGPLLSPGDANTIAGIQDQPLTGGGDNEQAREVDGWRGIRPVGGAVPGCPARRRQG